MAIRYPSPKEKAIALLKGWKALLERKHEITVIITYWDVELIDEMIKSLEGENNRDV